MKNDKINLLLMVLIVLVLGMTLLYQYQRPLVTAMFDKLFGVPPKPVALPVEMPPEVPSPEVAELPALEPEEIPSPEVKPILEKLPRTYEGLKFSSSYMYIKSLIMKKYRPVPKRRTRSGKHWRIVSDGTRVYNRRREIILEYMAPRPGYPRYLSFKFYNYVLTGVIEKYHGVDPKEQLEEVIDKYGMYRAKDKWKGKERYIWDDGQMQIIFLADTWAKSALFSFQIKRFATELR